MNWYFVRHGEIDSNVKKIYAGWSEEELTPRGRKQAIEVAKKLAHFDIDKIYTSPLRRAVQTAEIIGDFLNKAPFIERDFKELRLGIWEGMSEEEVSKQFPEKWKIWNTRPADLVLDDREPLGELLKRVLAGMEKIRAKQEDSAILIVTHVAIIRVLLLHTRKMDLNTYRAITVPNGKIFEMQNNLLY